MYRKSDPEKAELDEVRNKLYEVEAELVKLRNKKPLGERMSNWWYRNKPSEDFYLCMFFLTTIVGCLAGGAVCTASDMEDTARTEVQAIQMAIEHFHSSRVSVRCFESEDHGMLCELRHGRSKVMARCDTETCWTSL